MLSEQMPKQYSISLNCKISGITAIECLLNGLI